MSQNLKTTLALSPELHILSAHDTIMIPFNLGLGLFDTLMFLATPTSRSYGWLMTIILIM